MSSKISRLIPLAISGAVLIGFLINFKYFKLDLGQHFRYGAGMISTKSGAIVGTNFFVNSYLHISLFGLFLGGILLFAAHKRIASRSYLFISILMFTLFLSRPAITLIYFYSIWPEYISDAFIPTIKGQLFGLMPAYQQFDVMTRIQDYVFGLALLLLLIANLAFSFRHKRDPGYALHKQQKELLRQQAQARQGAFAAHQQQMQAQAMRQMPVQPQGASVSMTQELERLQHMYNSGALTEEEFTTAKKRVLGN